MLPLLLLMSLLLSQMPSGFGLAGLLQMAEMAWQQDEDLYSSHGHVLAVRALLCDMQECCLHLTWRLSQCKIAVTNFY
jgi:hypothetical protein